jgi:hypothetical protein
MSDVLLPSHTYLAYLDNPTSYQPRARKSAQRDEKPNSKSKNRAAIQTIGGSSDTSSNLPLAGSGAKLVVYPFPVRPNVFAELKLPADLTVDEASRLSAFLKAVALSDGSGGSQ